MEVKGIGEKLVPDAQALRHGQRSHDAHRQGAFLLLGLPPLLPPGGAEGEARLHRPGGQGTVISRPPGARRAPGLSATTSGVSLVELLHRDDRPGVDPRARDPGGDAPAPGGRRCARPCTRRASRSTRRARTRSPATATSASSSERTATATSGRSTRTATATACARRRSRAASTSPSASTSRGRATTCGPAIMTGIRVPDPGSPGHYLDRIDDPIRFNSSDICSFSPMGESTPGSVYLWDGARPAWPWCASSGGTAKVRTLYYRRGERGWTP